MRQNRKYSKEQLAAMHAKRGGGRFARFGRMVSPRRVLDNSIFSRKRITALEAERREILGKVSELKDKWRIFTDTPAEKANMTFIGAYGRAQRGRAVSMGSVLDVQRANLANAIRFRGGQLERVEGKIAKEKQIRAVGIGATVLGVTAPLAGVALFKTQMGRRLVGKGLTRFRPLTPLQYALNRGKIGLTEAINGGVERAAQGLRRHWCGYVTKGANQILGGPTAEFALEEEIPKGGIRLAQYLARYKASLEATPLSPLDRVQSAKVLGEIRKRSRVKAPVKGAPMKREDELKLIEAARRRGKVLKMAPGNPEAGIPNAGNSMVAGAYNALVETANQSGRIPGFLARADAAVFNRVVRPIGNYFFRLNLPKRDPLSSPGVARRVRELYERSASEEAKRSRGAAMIRGEARDLPVGEIVSDPQVKQGWKWRRLMPTWRPAVARSQAGRGRDLLRSGNVIPHDPRTVSSLSGTTQQARAMARGFQGKVTEIKRPDRVVIPRSDVLNYKGHSIDPPPLAMIRAREISTSAAKAEDFENAVFRAEKNRLKAIRYDLEKYLEKHPEERKFYGHAPSD